MNLYLVFSLLCLASLSSLGLSESKTIELGESQIQQCLTQGRPIQPNDFFGITAHLPLGPSDLDQAKKTYRIKLIKELGIKHIREDFLWDVIETQRGQFQTRIYQDLVDELAPQGIQILPILSYGNKLYNSTSNQDIYRPPNPLSAFLPFAEQANFTFENQKEHIYEIWNEPNVSIRFWKEGLLGQPREYGNLLKMTAQFIRQKDPRAKILLGGLFSAGLRFNIGLIFLHELHKLHPDIGNYYDVLSWHPYRYPHTSPETTSSIQYSLANELELLTQFYRAHHETPKEIWLTEIGWHTARFGVPPGVTTDEQANYLIRASLIAMDSGIQRMYWYELVDGLFDKALGEHAFGISTSDANILTAQPQPKPTFFAYRHLIKFLSAFDRILSIRQNSPLSDDQYAYLFCSSRAGNTNTSSEAAIVTWQNSNLAPTNIPMSSSDKYYFSKFSRDGKALSVNRNFEFRQEPQFYLAQPISEN